MSFIPNTTPTPNWLLNGEMKKMNETELKVVLLVIRKTLGWYDPLTKGRREQDYISQSQFMEFTGKSNRAIATAIDSCVKTGWIIARDRNGVACDTPEKRRRRKVWYQLGAVFINKISSEESSQDDKDSKNLVNILPKSSEHLDTNLVKKVHNTKETLTKETIQKEQLATPPTEESPFLWEEYLKKMGEDKNKALNIIAFFFRARSVTFETKKQAQIGIKRHLRVANQLKEFSPQQVYEAMKRVSLKHQNIDWTLETVLKALTK